MWPMVTSSKFLGWGRLNWHTFMDFASAHSPLLPVFSNCSEADVVGLCLWGKCMISWQSKFNWSWLKWLYKIHFNPHSTEKDFICKLFVIFSKLILYFCSKVSIYWIYFGSHLVKDCGNKILEIPQFSIISALHTSRIHMDVDENVNTQDKHSH